jgi:hypothetical protein
MTWRARGTIVGCMVLTAACATVDRDWSPRVEQTCTPSAETEQEVVLVTVRDRFGGPLPGVTVELLRSDGSILASGLTDAEGLARLGTSDPDPRVAVRARLPRFRDAEARGIVLKPGCLTAVGLTMLTDLPDADTSS